MQMREGVSAPNGAVMCLGAGARISRDGDTGNEDDFPFGGS